MAVRIITDSTADFSAADATNLHITTVPLKVVFGKEIYQDGITITHEEFFQKLTQCKDLPTTSQPSPDDFHSIFQQAVDAGDEVVFLSISSGISGTLQSASIARDMLSDGSSIYLIDTLQAAVGLRLLVEYAVRLRDEGMAATEIAAQLEQLKKRVKLYVMVDTLEFLHRGGRLNKTVKVVGTLLHMKPIVSLENGVVKLVGKARGVDGSVTALWKIMEENGPIDARFPLLYGYAGNDKLCSYFKKQNDEKFHLTDSRMYSVGSVIGTHVGPGAFIVSYVQKEGN